MRAIAEELKLPVFNKPDSQEICFVPNQDYAGLVQRRSPRRFREGELVTPTAKSSARTPATSISPSASARASASALGYPLYVVDIDPATNRVTLGEKDDAARIVAGRAADQPARAARLGAMQAAAAAPPRSATTTRRSRRE